MRYFDETGFLDRGAYASPQIYELELERIFRRCWLLLGPEHWAATPESFFLSSMGEDPVIVWRGRDGILRVFLNRCPCCDQPPCHAEAGRADRFCCDCREYSWDGAAGPISLARIANAEIYGGLLFASFASCPPSLHEALGEFGRNFAERFDRRPCDIEPGDPPCMRWRFNANWKLPLGDFVSDDARTMTVYPNLSFDRDSGGLYVWHPRGPTHTEVHSFSLFGTATPSMDRRYGPTSEWTQRHCVPWEEITRTAGNLHARHVPVALLGDCEANLRAFYAWWQAELVHHANEPAHREAIAIGWRTEQAAGDYQ